MNSKKEIIEKVFTSSQDSLVIQQSDLSLQSVSDMINNQAIDISPKYQRRERWKEDSEAELIESFLLNIPVPPIYLSEDEYGTYSVIDGKQRLTAINKFLNGDLKLNNLERFHEIEGYRFNDLPMALSNALKIRPYLRVITLLRQSNPDLKHEVFLRLNKSGVSLNAQEIRNVAFRGPLNNLFYDLSQTEYFAQQLKAFPGTKMYQEMTDVQYLLRFFTIKEYWESFPGKMDTALDNFMKENYKIPEDKINEFELEFIEALDFCKTVWGDQGFRKPNGNNQPVQGFFDVQLICPMLLSKQKRSELLKKPDAVRNELLLLLEDEDFYLSMTQFTSNPKYVAKRIGDFSNALRNL